MAELFENPAMKIKRGGSGQYAAYKKIGYWYRFIILNTEQVYKKVALNLKQGKKTKDSMDTID